MLPSSEDRMVALAIDAKEMLAFGPPKYAADLASIALQNQELRLMLALLLTMKHHGQVELDVRDAILMDRNMKLTVFVDRDRLVMNAV